MGRITLFAVLAIPVTVLMLLIALTSVLILPIFAWQSWNGTLKPYGSLVPVRRKLRLVQVRRQLR